MALGGDPDRLMRAYNQSAATLNLLRAFASGGYADLRNIHKWTLGFVDDSPQAARYRELSEKISSSAGSNARSSQVVRKRRRGFSPYGKRRQKPEPML